ncbi:helix-turn-helix domain-containing protein, partial [uncultured Bilophila sp.]|uniref:helix-turn-helix domain-containing protein n=1 Tax=uncultured Bilophila sp. TaxID=529385 RepID=UPI00280BDBE0
MRRKRYIRPMTRKHLNIGGKIQARRKAMGLSQEDLAQLTGVSRQSVTKWETGQSAPDLDRLVELADVLGVSLDFLLREPPQTSSSSSSALSSPPFLKNGVPEGPASFQEGGPSPVEASPAVAVGCSPFREEASSVSSCGGACGFVPAAKPSSTQLS